MKSLLLFSVLAFFSFSGFSQSVGDIEEADCFLPDCSFIPPGREVEFGKITVPEDYSKPDGRLMKMAFAVVKSNDSVKQPDPVIFFMPGWGMPAIENLGGLMYAYSFPGRDIIFFDRRGTGFSEPEMCDWLGAAAWEDLASDMSHEEFQKRQTERLNKCLDSLETKDIDFNRYGHNTQARDVLLLAEKLNYPEYNLLGISMGTRGVQNFLRTSDTSSVKVRSAIFDSALPMGRSMQGQMNTTYVRALDMLLEECKNNAACNSKFPDLKSRYSEFLSTLEDDPFVVPLQNGSEFSFNKEEVNYMLLLFASSNLSYIHIPIQIEQFINRNSKAIAAYMPMLQMGTPAIYNGVGAINFVYDHKAFQEQGTKDYNESLETEGDYVVVDGYVDFYMKDKRFDLDPLEGEPVKTSVPSLVLAGDFDPVSPPEWTEQLLPHLENHHYFKLPAMAHMLSSDPCVRSLMLEFLDEPAEKPAPACLEELNKGEIRFRITN
jgi:pimeloyl-ACP methyl ester carboxylesterase